MTPAVKSTPLACTLGLSVAVLGCTDHATTPISTDLDAGDAALAAAEGTASAVLAPSEFVVLGNGNSLPSGLEEEVARSGGEVVLSVPQIGVAVVRSDDAAFAAELERLNDVASVTANLVVRMTPTRIPAPEVTDQIRPELADPPDTDIGDRFFDLQWSMDALDWTEAVEISEVRGAGARVAILDSGIRSSHNEFAANLNTALSTSFVFGEEYDNPAGFHGTHVSGIVAAAQNGLGTIGVAPEVDLVSVKVLSGITGTGSFAGIAAGLVYAADMGADVVNMSIGATLDHSGAVYDRDCNVVGQASPAAVAATVNLLARAGIYAYQNGVTLIASAGNCGTDGDTDADRVHLPSDVPHVLSISATAPVGWGLDPETNLDRLASYSNHGRSVIDFAAPGGDAVLPGNDVCQILTGAAEIPLVQFCWVLDLVMSASNSSDGGYAWTAGTSMAAPAAAGVAALIVSRNGGAMHPAQVVDAMRKAVNFDDGGEAGNGRTSHFGRGHLSALEALQ